MIATTSTYFQKLRVLTTVLLHTAENKTIQFSQVLRRQQYMKLIIIIIEIVDV